jgi:hypothetical protein
VIRAAFLFLAAAALARAEEDPAASLARLRGEPRRAERRDIVSLAEAADRLASGGHDSAWRIAADLYALAYRGYREPGDLATALDRLEHAGRAEHDGCDAAHATAVLDAEFARPEVAYLAFHRVARRCPNGPEADAADRALAILAPFRPSPEALAAVERDPSAPLPALVAPALPADAGPPADAAPPRDGGQALAADAAPLVKRGPAQMIIRFSDAGTR